MQSMFSFIESLNLGIKGKFDGFRYLVIMKDSNEFSKVYNALSLNKDLELDDESVATDAICKYSFSNEWYTVTISANFENDLYKLTVEATNYD